MSTPRAASARCSAPACGERSARKPPTRVEVERAVARDDRVVDAERVEARREQVDLVAVGRAQALGGQPLLGEEGEHAGGAVVARRVVGRAGEALGPAPVGDARRVVLVGQRAELRVPAGDRRAQVLGVRGQAQEAVALARAAGTCSRRRPPRPTPSPSSWRANGTAPSAW